MAQMFSGCESLMSLDLTKFNTTNVKFMQEIFKDCKSLEDFKISTFDTKNVIKMESMFQNCYKLKKIDLVNFYTQNLRHFHSMFSGCISLNSVNIINFDTFQVTNFANLFYNCFSLQNLDLSNICTNMANDFSFMFYNCSRLSSLNLTNFNTERVVKMNSMFEECSSLQKIVINSFINTQTIDISRMFYGCSNLISFDLSKFNTNQIKYMNSLFYACKSFTYLDLSHFDTKNVIDMNSMFSECSSLRSIKLSNFNVINVRDMSSMFSGCENLLSLDIKSFKTNNLEKTNSMFKNCKSIKYLILSNFITSNIVSMSEMFYGCNSLKELDLSKFQTNKVIHMDSIFYECNSLIMLDLSKFVLSNVINMGYMFYGCKSLTSINFPNLKNLSMSNTSYMFAGCSSIPELYLSDLDTHNVISFEHMFSECVFLKNIYLDKLNTAKGRNMDYMFAGCSSLTSLDISSFKTPLLESVKGMFYGCSSLLSLDISTFNISSVINTAYMFYKASSLISLKFLPSTGNIKYFDTSLVTNMRFMFGFCSNIEILDLSFFNTSKVLDMSYMFAECANLSSLDLSSFTTSNVKTMEGMFYNDLKLYYINLANIHDYYIENIKNILENTPINGVFCINRANVNKIYEIIKQKDCHTISCESNPLKYIKKLDFKTNRCLQECFDELKYEYDYICYEECPNNTYADNYRCKEMHEIKGECTIQKLLLSQCNLTEYPGLKEDTKEQMITFIDSLLLEILNNKLEEVISKVINWEDVIYKIYNTTFHFSTFSNHKLFQDLTYIDVKDCENILKLKNNLNADEVFILLIIEYNIQEFKIPIVEYKVFSEFNGTEIDISPCNNMNFTYSIPINNYEINADKLYMHNPESDYNNKICYQYKTDNKTDITLFERRKIFNENNMSICENNCKLLGYENQRAICECPIKTDFNKFLLKNDLERDNSIFKFQNNKLSEYNFEVLKCFRILFTKDGIKGNISSIFYIVLFGLNSILLLVFCVKEYKFFYGKIKWLSYKEEKENKAKIRLNDNNNTKIVTNKIINTTGNPPKNGKLKSLNINNKKFNNKIAVKKNDQDKNLKSKDNKSISLSTSKRALNKITDNNLILNTADNKQNIDLEDDLSAVVDDMEKNFLPYIVAVKNDKRSFCQYYCSLIKCRHLLFSIFTNDYNSLVIKFCFFLYIFGISLGINTIFFNDESIQKIYEAQGMYTFQESIIYHMFSILLSTICVLIIKSITALIIYGDQIIFKLKENHEEKNEEKINMSLIKIMSRGMILFIFNFIFIIIFWLYVGSFCAIFKNTQLYLIINGSATFILLTIIPFSYYFIPGFLRMAALSGRNCNCLYKFSQFIQLI